ncbi:MAG: flagellar type III secretion system pore protein FliP [Desulfobacterales bacterium]|nr:flagellar type III secretion system pore protein FliP [Desulfobacterales bacterium]
MKLNKRNFFLILLILLSGFWYCQNAVAQTKTTTFPIPSIQIGIGKANEPEEVAVALEVIALLTILTLAPALMVLTTPFTRIVVVFHFLRQALGIQTSPPNQVILGLAMFMTFFIMKPIWTTVYETSLSPYIDKEMTYQEAFEKAQIPIREFLLLNTREKDIALFIKSTKSPKPQNKEELSLLLLIPAFVISELKTAFIIGFVLYVPFLIIDMVVASVLLAMGMMMLPPVMISLPFKIMLFVLVDGWNILTGSLLKSFVIGS